ncbi:hypothetical protein [Pseudomonas pseudonitroreducens]|uniref:hypothetical protein n=1 Tax=Pseudomonas pseudonitroreducens TaxID=2892326 RepID=UPI001F31EBD0|nr:hypothetical protein [Pseudomonas pseudonitroreducens]
MAYVNGSAGSLESLRQSLFDACTANGWSLAGSVLFKGSIYMQVLVQGAYLTIQGGTGVDGSNALVNPAPNYSRIGLLAGQALTWPMAYEVFIGSAPDEVYLVVNYNVDCYQYLAFGGSSMSGLPGTGAWFSASVAQTVQYIGIYPYGGARPGFPNGSAPAMFHVTNTDGGGIVQNSFIHHGFDSKTWTDANYTNGANAINAAVPHVLRLPNAWNSEGVLVPIQVHIFRPESKVTLVADLKNARYTRVDNYDPGQIIPLGPDRWKIFPWYRKNAAVRDGGDGINHTGTMGWAVRYDGP